MAESSAAAKVAGMVGRSALQSVAMMVDMKAGKMVARTAVSSVLRTAVCWVVQSVEMMAARWAALWVASMADWMAE